jgi:hypothetical protein
MAWLNPALLNGSGLRFLAYCSDNAQGNTCESLPT